MLVLFVFSATIADNFVFNKISSCDLAELWNSASRNLSLRDSILVIRSTSTWLGGKLFGKSKMKVQITIKLVIYFLMLRKLQPSNNKLITGLFKSTGFLPTWFAQPIITNPVVHVASVQLDSKLYPRYMPRMLNKDLTPFFQSFSRVSQNWASERKALLSGCFHVADTKFITPLLTSQLAFWALILRQGESRDCGLCEVCDVCISNIGAMLFEGKMVTWKIHLCKNKLIKWKEFDDSLDQI